MAAPRDESRVVTPFMPSLQHCASVKMAVLLFHEFDVGPLEDAYTEIQRDNLTASEAKGMKSRRAKESLLCIPHHLRQGVMEAVLGSWRTILIWRMHQGHFNVSPLSLHWRSDGSVDTVRTAQDLVRNAQFDIQERFRLACKYFLEESVRALWAEMVQTGEAGSFGTRQEDVVSLWVEWLQERPRSSWTEGLVRSLGTWLRRCTRMHEFRFPRWSAFFHVLRPEQRRECLSLEYIDSEDDLRFCLYSLTREEEERMLLERGMPFTVLRLHLEWPLQSLFLRTAERLWSYLEGQDFRRLVYRILNANEYWKDYHYAELFHGFWNASPLRLREFAREDRDLSEKVDSFFEKQKEKAKIC